MGISRGIAAVGLSLVAANGEGLTQPQSVSRADFGFVALEESVDVASPGTPAVDERKYIVIVERASRAEGVEGALVHALIFAESAYDPAAVSPAGATGLMQLMPDTARRYGVANLFDPEQNVRAGVRHLKDLLEQFDGDVELAIAAYNAGPNAVIRAGNRVPPYPETRRYVPRVLDRYHRLRLAPQTPRA